MKDKIKTNKSSREAKPKNHFLISLLLKYGQKILTLTPCHMSLSLGPGTRTGSGSLHLQWSFQPSHMNIDWECLQRMLFKDKSEMLSKSKWSHMCQPTKKERKSSGFNWKAIMHDFLVKSWQLWTLKCFQMNTDLPQDVCRDWCHERAVSARLSTSQSFQDKEMNKN